jgi:hypothetical protein
MIREKLNPGADDKHHEKPGAKAETVANSGHFLSLDQPEQLATCSPSAEGCGYLSEPQVCY